ncbi:MAG: SAM-dependent DNA methyltransferase [Chloroflexi bacterium]|nr:SAM-dependent DNA methyltransferase [Chloroflexota bacterium]
MAVDERTFVADVKGWIDAILRERPGLPYSHARVEEHTISGRQRHDLVLFGRNGLPVLSGEVKMPDSVIGKKNPYHEELVRDAYDKARDLGVDYYFTWNVRDFALFQTLQAGVQWNERKVAGRHVVDVIDSDDVRKADVEEAIKQFWVTLLESLPAHFAGRRVLRELALDELFIRRIEAALEEPIDSTERELGRRHREDEAFRSSIVAWMVEQGWEDTGFEDILRENLKRAARLSCYVLLTRLVFYEVLRKRFRVIAPLAGTDTESPEDMAELLEARFDDAMRRSRDYETVFAPKDFGRTLPLLAPDAHVHWGSVIRRIEEFDFSQLDFDVIGQLNEQLIGHDERRQYGQFYTSPDVVDLINAFCIRTADATVLDPACGGGTFLVRAYARKQALARREGERVDHRRVLEEIYGVDRATFPAQLSTINLAVRSITNERNYPRVGRLSFFEVQQGNPLTRLPEEGERPEDIYLPVLDAVVGNPPYIRQERIEPKDKQVIENLARKEWPGGVRFSGRSDIYAHFFAHAALS